MLVAVSTTTLEVCVDSADGLQASLTGGADRIELCSALALGGLTPSLGLMQLAASLPMPVYALIRPRPGDFCFTGDELQIMCSDIETAQHTDLSGVVLGASNADGTLDINTLATLCRTAGTMKKTLHRVIDTVPDPLQALEQAVELGFNNVLTSGGTISVEHGIDQLAKLHRQAEGRINIIAGAGLSPALVKPIARVGIRSFHSSCSILRKNDQQLVSMGFAASDSAGTDAMLVRQFKTLLSTLAD